MDHREDSLFQDFPKIEALEWVKKATTDLKGEDPIQKFSWNIDEDILIKPYYDASDLKELKNINSFQNRLFAHDAPTAEPRVWNNIQQIIVDDEKSANSKALGSLISGADGIHFILDKQVDVEQLLADIQPESCKISFTLNVAIAKNLIFDLAKVYELTGSLELENPTVEDSIHLLKDWKGSKKFKLLGVGVSTTKSIIGQVAQQLLQINTIIANGSAAGLSLGDILNHLYVICAVGTDYFVEISKLRALRNLAFQVAQAYGANDFEPENLEIRAVSTPWINDTYEPYGNLLKSSTAAMAAVLGGCNELLVLPNPDEEDFSCRIARNISLVLKEEAHLNKSTDPVAGSYYLEALTDNIAAKAWTIFQNQVKNN